METTPQQARQLKQVETASVNAFKNEQISCCRCGYGNRADMFRYTELECFNCKRKGNRASKCRHFKTKERIQGEEKNKYNNIQYPPTDYGHPPCFPCYLIALRPLVNIQ